MKFRIIFGMLAAALAFVSLRQWHNRTVRRSYRHGQREGVRKTVAAFRQAANHA